MKIKFYKGNNMSYILDEFRKNWDDEHGFTYEEAMIKKAAVDEAHGVGTPGSCWNPAVIEPDQYKKDGYKVVITPKIEQ